MSTLTRNPDREDPFAGRLPAAPLDFSDPDGLCRSMQGAGVPYNTYWIRFARGRITFEQAVENSRVLFDAAARAGVGRIVHLSVANTSPESALPYFRGKGQVEEILKEAGRFRLVIVSGTSRPRRVKHQKQTEPPIPAWAAPPETNRCHDATMPRCHDAHATPCHMLPCCHVAMLPCCHVAMLPCCHVAMLPCCHVAMLPCCHVAMLPCCHRLSTGHGPQPPARREFPVFAAGSGATGPTVRPRGRTPPGCPPGPTPWPPTAGRRPQEPGPAAGFSPPTRPWRRPHRPQAALTCAGGSHARPPASRRAATISRGAKYLTPRCAPMLK